MSSFTSAEIADNALPIDVTEPRTDDSGNGSMYDVASNSSSVEVREDVSEFHNWRKKQNKESILDKSKSYFDDDNFLNCGKRSKLLFIVALIITCLLITILTPASFHGVEYYEYAFKKNTITNTVDYDTVYENGNHYWGVSYTKFTFQRTLQKITLDLAVLPKSGLEFIFHCTIYYHLNKDQLALLFKSFGRDNYNEQITKIAIGVLKNTSPKYTIEEHIQDRGHVRAGYEKELQIAFAQNHVILPNGMFFLGGFRFPPQIDQSFLDASIQNQKNIEQKYIMDYTVINKDTDKLVAQINQNITYIRSITNTQKENLLTDAQALSFNIEENAKSQGFSRMINTLEITNKTTVNTLAKVLVYLEKNPIFMENMKSNILLNYNKN
jgi:hypothetical protein